MLFSSVERFLNPVAAPLTPAARFLGTPVPTDAPPHRLLGFYWHFIRQARLLFGTLFVAGLLVALLDISVPTFVGKLIALLASHTPQTLWTQAGGQLLRMALVMLVARPLALLSQNVITQQGINASFTSLIRWQSHWQVIRQGLPFFQEDFSGRIANRVMQSGSALRESVVQVINTLWYVAVYGTAALVVLGRMDWRLAMPLAVWVIGFSLMLRTIVPRLRRRAREASAQRSQLTGKVVDSYTNIQTVKLFARAQEEDNFVQEGVLSLNEAFLGQMRLTTVTGVSLALLNALMLTGTATVGVYLWMHGRVGLDAVATALPISWQIANVSGWVAFSVTGIFENIGVVQEAMDSIAVAPTAPDAPGARELQVSSGAIEFQDVRFGYGRERAVLEHFQLRIAGGERVGLVGHSGAGKSTLMNLLLGFFRPELGRILVDGQDVQHVTQESLRAALGVVTQDTALLHRSIADNIRYGRQSATQAEVAMAASRASADGFIEQLEDWRGRHGYDAHVGERGVKLSGGQRQRIAIARVLLKNAPILILDEATSALDSEVEAVIQEQLSTLMTGKTVIAIAHRLSTLARMDRLVVLEHGRIAEEGTHASLLEQGGVYARLWQRQGAGAVLR